MEVRMDYTEIERRLRELLQVTRGMLSPRDLEDASEFLEVGEHALVLETIAGGVAGEKLDPEIAGLIEELAKAMELTEGMSYQLFWRSLPRKSVLGLVV
jgi:hypothetical protein